VHGPFGTQIAVSEPIFNQEATFMKRVILAAAIGAFGTALHAADGYVTQGAAGATPVTSGFGLCVHDGFWSPSKAAEPCDRVPRASVPPPVAAAAPAPEPAAQAAPQPAPIVSAPPLEKVTLSSDVLFQFDKAELTEAGKAEIDKLAAGLSDASIDNITVVGHADRIGSDQYNQRLSERRAEAVKNYLQQSKANMQNIAASGKGESEPVTGDDCKNVKGRDRLIKCLQPDRRVEVEVFGTRTAASGTGTPGAASGSSSGSSQR
jgi:OOP family OmpA-OmpF porin